MSTIIFDSPYLIECSTIASVFVNIAAKIHKNKHFGVFFKRKVWLNEKKHVTLHPQIAKGRIF
jgi:hypothetical protein